jgi:hypothetical protein
VVEIVKAVLVGMLSNVVRRLGPSLILFAYIWALHSKIFTSLGPQLFGMQSKYWLAVAAIMLGVVALAFKDTVGNIARSRDRRAFPYIQQLVLCHLNHHDMAIMNLHRVPLEVFAGLKSATVFSLLIVIAAASFPLFAIVLIGVVAAIVVLSLNAARYPAVHPGKSFVGKLQTHPEYYAEVLVIAGLILAFAAIASEKSFVSGTVFIMIVSRYSGEIKILARAIVATRRSQLQNRKFWAARATALAAKQARWAEAQARLKARDEQLAARRSAAAQAARDKQAAATKERAHKPPLPAA